MAQLQNVQVPTVLTTDSLIFISWTLPPLATPTNEQHAVVRAYIVEYRAFGTSRTEIAMEENGAAVNITISGLRADTNYTLNCIVDYSMPEIKGTPVVMYAKTKRTGE